MQEGAVTHAAPFLSYALALSTMWEIAASVELLERKGILTRQQEETLGSCNHILTGRYSGV